MRKLLIALITCTLLPLLYSARPETAAGASALTLVNLTKDRIVEHNPSIGWSLDGGLIVAWDQNVSINGTIYHDVLARVQKNGVFGPAYNISNSAAPSEYPSLFNVGSLTSMLYQEEPHGTGDIMRSDWSGTAWSAPQLAAGGDYVLSYTPVGVQASDGTIWLARWVRTTGNFSDLIVQQVGGPAFNVSNDGRAWRNPDLVAGDSGQVYVAWIDHTHQPAGFAPGVRVAQVTTGGVTAMPQPTNDYFAYWPSLAFRGGQLYVVWLGTTTRVIKERVWDGSRWGTPIRIASGDKPRLAMTADGIIYVAWENNGQIFLRKSLGTPRLLSGGLTNATQPALTVDGSGNAHVAFLAGGDVWYVQVPGH